MSYRRKPPVGFGERLREAIYKSGLSNSYIERHYGINHASINSYILETVAPTVPTLAILCKALNVSADYLLFGGKKVKCNT